MGEVGMVPLFIKAPGQTRGETIDRPTCTTEILPEMARILGIDLPWTPAACDRETVRLDNGAGTAPALSFAETIAQRQRYIEGNAALFGGDGAGWNRAFYWGRFRSLIGQAPGSLDVSSASEEGPRATPDTSGPAVSSLDPGVELNPVLRQRGRLSGIGANVPLAVSVNGRIAAVGQSYTDKGKVLYSILIPRSALRPGENAISLFAIETTGAAQPGSPSVKPQLKALWSSDGQ